MEGAIVCNLFLFRIVLMMHQEPIGQHTYHSPTVLRSYFALLDESAVYIKYWCYGTVCDDTLTAKRDRPNEPAKDRAEVLYLATANRVDHADGHVGGIAIPLNLEGNTE